MPVQDKFQNCPICNREVAHIQRYPDYVCDECVVKAKDRQGRSVSFANQDISGGLIGFVKDPVTGFFNEDSALTANPTVLIEGIECYADEAKFGGIVIRPTRKS